jgi:hypothetical protein
MQNNLYLQLVTAYILISQDQYELHNQTTTENDINTYPELC